MVDELHTFDGAQGTDLACLTRRLKARLGVERGALVCVGTSATLGTEESREDLLRYAERIFDEPFGSEAVVGETRQTVDEFLGDTLITYTLGVPPDVEAIVDHTRYRGVEEYLRAQHRLFFGTDIEGAFEDSEWRLNLGERLRRHAFFVNLLRVLERQPRSLAAIVERFRGAVSVDSERTLGHLLNALCALLATARARAAPTQGPADLEGQTSQLATTAPLVQLRLQLWVRELRRMVASVWATPAAGTPTTSRATTSTGTCRSCSAGPVTPRAGAVCRGPGRARSGRTCAPFTTTSSAVTATRASCFL